MRPFKHFFFNKKNQKKKNIIATDEAAQGPLCLIKIINIKSERKKKERNENIPQQRRTYRM